MYGYHTQISLTNQLEFRCHVQPTATISALTDCRGKRLVAHEDEHRPQCFKGTFSRHVFNYTLLNGSFNPNLVAYWKELDDQEGKQLITLDKETGNYEIIYDYIRFGCPLEPYPEDNFVPDLRIVTPETQYNSSVGEKYKGPFLMIEVFGTRSFYFTKKFSDANCQFAPIDLNDYIEDWVHRKRMFKINLERQQTFASEQEIDSFDGPLDALVHLGLGRGNKLFAHGPVNHPINIINRVVSDSLLFT